VDFRAAVINNITSYKGKTVDRRPVPLTARLRETLLDLFDTPSIAAFKTGRKSKLKPDKALVFGVTKTLQRSWEAARAEANLTHVRLHDLRHTAATRLKKELPITDVGLILGHSDPRTTQGYVNRTPVLADALMTHGTVLARLGKDDRARARFEEAIEVAQTAGDLESAGNAKLAIIEELGNRFSVSELIVIYRSAVEFLRNSQHPTLGKRLIACAAQLFDTVERLQATPKQPPPSWDGFSLKRYIRAGERVVIERALRDAGGSVSKASRLLGFRHHQSLISLLNTRHKDPLEARSKVRKRRRNLTSPKKRNRETPKQSRLAWNFGSAR